MNILKPQFVIIIFLLILIISILVFIRIQSATQKGIQLPPEIQIFKYFPSPSIKPKGKIPIPTTPPHSPIPYDQLTPQQKDQYQSQADEYYQKVRSAIINNYPWYLNLPIQEKYYFVYFDPPSETFTAKLYPQKSFDTSIDAQTENLKKAVILRIKSLGSDAEQYKVEWVVIPE